MAKKIEVPENTKELPLAVIRQMTSLATSGFGLVAALAWNDLVKEIIKLYIEPLTGKASGFISLVIYALVVTLLAVIVTLHLSRLEHSLEKKKQRKDSRKQARTRKAQ